MFIVISLHNQVIRLFSLLTTGNTNCAVELNAASLQNFGFIAVGPLRSRFLNVFSLKLL